MCARTAEDGATLYLEKEEIEKLFRKLPRDLREAWRERLQEETLNRYETSEELLKRMEHVPFDRYPQIAEFGKGVMEALERGESMESISAEGFPDDALPRFFHTIGACGVAALIQMSLQSPDVDNDAMEAIAGLSTVRHLILEANALTSA